MFDKKPIFFSKAMFAEVKNLKEDNANLKSSLIESRAMADRLEHLEADTRRELTAAQDTIKNLQDEYHNRTNEIDQLRGANDELREELVNYESKIAELTEQLAKANEDLVGYDELKNNPYNMESLVENEGWFVLTGSYEGSEGVKVSMDWSDEFITALFKSNISGESDDIIVRKWLLLACEQIIDDLEERSMEEASTSVGREYV